MISHCYAEISLSETASNRFPGAGAATRISTLEALIRFLTGQLMHRAGSVGQQLLYLGD
jgi:hypothetical protein